MSLSILKWNRLWLGIKLGGSFQVKKRPGYYLSQSRVSHNSKTSKWACFCGLRDTSQVIERQVMQDFETHYESHNLAITEITS